MELTPNLRLPYILAAQAQKHVTHNEAVRALDAVVQLSVADKDLAAPPGAPADGVRYIVAASPTGAWAGHAGDIAAFQDGAWAFLEPLEGWLAWVGDEDKIYAYDGAAWVLYASGGGSTNLNPATGGLVGVNATADTTNRLSVASPATLLNHEGAGHQVKVNKNVAANTASFLFQTAFSGRAEMGTTGDDDFHFKVSGDGSSWKEALTIDRNTGVVTMPFTPGGGGGEANTASNVGTAGVGVFKQKTGVNLEFKKLNAGSSKVTVTDDTANSEVDIDVAEANLTLSNLGGSIDLGGAKASGTLAAARFPALTGDVTTTAGALGATIANDAVTNAKLANVATATIKGRSTAGTGDPEDLTPAQVRTLINVADGANNYTHPNHSGDVTSVGDGATTIANNVVSNAKLTDVPTATFKGRTTAGTGDPEDLTVAQAKTLLNLTGTNSGDQTIALSGDVSGSGTAGITATIGNDVVTNAKLANVAAATFKGRTTAGTGDPEDLTATQATALLNAVVGDAGSGGTKGLAPAPVAGDAAAGKFLHANGTWAVPPGTGGGESNTASNVNVGGVGVFKQKSGVNLEFRGINAASTKISVTLDAANNEIDVDVTEANLTLANLGGAIDLGSAKASGTLAAARMPALTGDVSNTAGTLATTIANDTVSNAKLANMAANTLKGNNTGATADPADLTAAQVKTLLAIAAGDVSGLAASATTDTTNASNIASGTLGSARLPAFGSGDVSFAAAGGAGTVAGNAITNAKLADVPTATFKGRVTAATGDPEDLTVAQAKTLLNLTGTNSGDQTITLSGDVSGSGTAGITATIGNDTVTNAKLANMATATLKGRTTAGTGDPEDLTATQATALLNAMVGDAGSGGTKGLVPAPAAGDAAAGRFLKADGTWAVPAGGGGGEANTASNVNAAGVGVFKQKTGVNLEFRGLNAGSSKVTITDDTANNEIDIDVAEANLTLGNLGGSIDLGGAKASGTIAAARMPAHTGDVTSTAGSLALTVANDAVSNAKLANVATATIKGRVTAATGDPEDLTTAQATTLIDTFTTTLKGSAPASGGGTTNYLRADGTWAQPPGSGGGAVTRISGSSGAAGADITFQRLSADAAANSTTTLATVMTTTGVGAGLWAYQYMVRYQSSATTTGIGLAVNHTGTTTTFLSHSRFVSTGGAAATGIADGIANVNGGQLVEGKSERVKNVVNSSTAGVDTANADCLIVLEGLIEVSTSGDLELRAASEVAASAITIKAQTLLELKKVA